VLVGDKVCTDVIGSESAPGGITSSLAKPEKNTYAGSYQNLLDIVTCTLAQRGGEAFEMCFSAFQFVSRSLCLRE
jgi:hypothetical protein